MRISRVLLMVFWLACTTLPQPAPERPPLPGGLPDSCILPGCAIPGAFTNEDEAAIAAFDYLQRNHPDWKLYEYAGCIFSIDGSLKATLPVSLPIPDRKICLPPAIPSGARPIAHYHNHTSKEDFSAAVDLNPTPTVPQYLLTPSGAIKKYVVPGGSIVKLR